MYTGAENLIGPILKSIMVASEVCMVCSETMPLKRNGGAGLTDNLQAETNLRWIKDVGDPVSNKVRAGTRLTSDKDSAVCDTSGVEIEKTEGNTVFDGRALTARTRRTNWAGTDSMTWLFTIEA